jgi:hypothetical protein
VILSAEGWMMRADRKLRAGLGCGLCILVGGLLTPTSTPAQEQFRIVAAGYDGENQKYILDEFSFGEYSCEGDVYLTAMVHGFGAELSFDLSNDATGETQTFTPTPEITTAYGGMDVAVYRIDPFPYGLAPGSLTLYAPLDPSYAVSLDSNNLCPGYGFEAKLIWVLIVPNRSRDFEAWLVQNGYSADLEPAETGYSNLWRISVPAGSEVKVLEELPFEDWFIDAKRYSIEAGPNYGYVDFDGGSTFGGPATQNIGRQVLTQALQSVFGDRVAERDVTVADDEGLMYKWTFKAPTEVALPGDDRFAGYWLKTVIRFTFSDQGERGWRLQVDSTDGYLPYWQRDDEPPGSLFNSAHLSDEGSDDTTNFASLIAFQDQLVTRFAELWNGSARTLE